MAHDDAHQFREQAEEAGEQAARAYSPRFVSCIVVAASPFDRLAAWAHEVREQAANLPPGSERAALLKKAEQADAACRLNDWANSPELQPVR